MGVSFKHEVKIKPFSDESLREDFCYIYTKRKSKRSSLGKWRFIPIETLTRKNRKKNISGSCLRKIYYIKL